MERRLTYDVLQDFPAMYGCEATGPLTGAAIARDNELSPFKAPVLKCLAGLSIQQLTLTLKVVQF